MDHNLDDSLNLESDMGSMDFDHSGEVVTQEDITLEATGHEGDMPMEFDHIEEQPMLMDTGSEEIIVSDFMGDQYTLQEYSTQDEVIPETSELVESNQINILESQSESIIDLNFDTKAMTQSMAQEVPVQPKYIHVKAAAIPPARIKKEVPIEVPRHVAIAPKPPKLAPAAAKTFSLSSPSFAIAQKPTPTYIIGNKNASLMKKVSLTGVLQGGSNSSNAVLTQIGKQLVMVPASGAQKIKLVTSGSGVHYVRANANEQGQLISAKQITGTNVQRPMLKKFIVQNIQSQSSAAEGPAPPTLRLAAGGGRARYVMQPKTVPISIGGTKVLLTSPSKQGIKLKKQIISIQQPQKLLSATSQGATKKVVITANPSQNVILKTTAPPKTAQITKEGQVVVQGQRSQLHQINVPGKGIQYIRLITNPTPAPQKPAIKPSATVTVPSYVLSDTKGNIIHMSEGMSSEDPPPLIPTGSVSTPKMTSKPQKKLVRIAPRPIKSATVPMSSQQSRSSQSLLAPLSPVEVTDHDQSDPPIVEQPDIEETALSRDSMVSEGEDSYATIQALPNDDDERRMVDHDGMHEVEVEFERHETSVEEEESNSMEALDSSNRTEEHPLIVIPSNYDKNMRVSSESSRHSMMTDCKEYPNMQINVEGESIPIPYLSPKQSQALSETDMVSGDLGLRPRKACNCTKSQCLKLYCDCFANGEFCNSCNCTNCHNNLENEELRQKAIRACLDRNPNAFRPKIGKAKSLGPDVVRRHNKGCNCKRSGCLKNYCECYEAKIACTAMCKCVGCRNIEETLDRRRDVMRLRDKLNDPMFRPKPVGLVKQPCSFMTSEVIEAVCQCLVAAAVEGGDDEDEMPKPGTDPMSDVIEEFARCLQDIISASHQSHSVDEGQS